MTQSHRHAAGTLLFIGASAAFGQGTTRDSAGLRIHDYRDVKSIAAAFVVGDSPSLRFTGGADPATSAEHSTAMLRMKDGRIAVAVAPPRLPLLPPDATLEQRRVPPGAPPPIIEVRLYDTSGAFIRGIGRAGQGGGRGGGQFSGAIFRLFELPERTILASENIYRWAHFADDGRILYAAPMSPTQVFGAFPDGSLLVGARRTGFGRTVSVEGMSFTMAMTTFSRLSPGKPTPAPMPFATSHPVTVMPGGFTGQRVTVVPYPVSTTTTAVVGGDHVWTFDVMTWEARLFDANGSPRAIVRLPVPARAAGAKLGDRFSADSLHTSRLLADDTGRLWIDAGSPGAGQQKTRPFTRDWTVIGSDGRLLGSVLMPEGFFPYHIGGEVVLGALGDSATGGFSVALFQFAPAKR
jgi:hypothetical protein